eukprot:scaffold47017_cov67-Phaeocystis_antarctica.AAC.1
MGTTLPPVHSGLEFRPGIPTPAEPLSSACLGGPLRPPSSRRRSPSPAHRPTRPARPAHWSP